MKIAINLKVVAAGHLVVGAILIALPFVLMPHIRVITKAAPDMPSVVRSLKADSEDPASRSRAAELLEQQLTSLETLRDVNADLLFGVQVCGMFMVFTGLVVLLRERRVSHETKPT